MRKYASFMLLEYLVNTRIIIKNRRVRVHITLQKDTLFPISGSYFVHLCITKVTSNTISVAKDIKHITSNKRYLITSKFIPIFQRTEFRVWGRTF